MILFALAIVIVYQYFYESVVHLFRIYIIHQMFNKFVSKGGFKDLKFSRRDFKFELRWLLWSCRVRVETKP